MLQEQRKKLGATEEEIAFLDLSDSARTKHVHGLHPYMGKFIPQLVEYYLKRNFNAGDVILDPFAGSGTTLVEANVLGMHSIGVDVAAFNCIIMNAKLTNYNLLLMELEVKDILHRVSVFSWHHFKDKSAKRGFFSKDLITQFKSNFDPVQTKIIDFVEKNDTHNNSNTGIRLLKKRIQQILERDDSNVPPLEPYLETDSEYIRTWFAPRSIAEMNYYASLIPEYTYKDLLMVILSRAVRSARLVRHDDLTRPKKPLSPGEKYYCRKHNKFCSPTTECLKFIRLYSIGKKGAINQIKEFNRIRSDKQYYVVHADSRTVNLKEKILSINKSPEFNIEEPFIDGVFTSPPYVGLIDYHDQHKYAYELFKLPTLEQAEIGPAFSGTSLSAKKAYKTSMIKVLKNIRPYLKDKAKLFIVANDRFGLYEDIIVNSNYELIEKTLRPVYKRADHGGASTSYAETIFTIVPE